MSDEPDAETETRLIRSLQAEADEVRTSPDAWTTLQSRIDADALRRTTSHAPRPSPDRPQPRRALWRGPASAVIALGLVVAAVLFLTTYGWQRTALPGPAQPPSAAPTPGAASSSAVTPTTGVDGGFRPSQPRVAWTVYRPGADRLYADAARASAPFNPVQAMNALFDQDPTVPGATVVPNNHLNKAASVTYADSMVHLDMASVDDQTRIEGSAGQAQARRWVEAWALTASAALDAYGPVLITLDGRPTRLYGVVDTSKPLLDPGVAVERPAVIYFPSASAAVTSPVAVAAMPAAVGDRLVVRDLRTGAPVSTVTADAANGGQMVMSAAPDLAPGDYTVALVRRSGRVEEQHRFTVTARVASDARSPVTDPPTSEVATTLVYYPGQHDQLQAQPWPRTTLAAAVGAISGEPAGDDVSWPFGSLTLASIHESDNQVVVDYSADEHVVPGKPDSSVASFWAQSLVHTVAAYEGRPMPVLVTLRGKPFRLFGLLDTSEPFRYRTVVTGTTAALALPTAVPAPGPLQIVGAVRAGVDHIAWYLVDRVSQETLYQGTIPVGADQTYGFALTVPTGRYDLRVDEGTKAGARGQSYDRSVDVT